MRRATSVSMAATAALLALTACGAGDPAREADDGATSPPVQPSPGEAGRPGDVGGPTRSPSARPPTTLRPPSAAEQAELDQRLRQAAWANQVDRAAALIDRGADVNAQDDTQQSAYLIATSEGYLELLRLTLARGADLSAKDSFNGTGLIRAAERGHHRVVGELLEAGIARDHVNRLGYQAIHEAVWLGEDTADYVATIRALAAGGVELDRPSVREGLTPLQMAQERGFGALEAAMRAALDERSSGRRQP